MGSNLSQQAQARSNIKHTRKIMVVNDVISTLVIAVFCNLRSLQESIPGGKGVRLEAIYSKCFGHICLVPRVGGYINL